MHTAPWVHMMPLARNEPCTRIVLSLRRVPAWFIATITGVTTFADLSLPLSRDFVSIHTLSADHRGAQVDSMSVKFTPGTHPVHNPNRTPSRSSSSKGKGARFTIPSNTPSPTTVTFPNDQSDPSGIEAQSENQPLLSRPPRRLPRVSTTVIVVLAGLLIIACVIGLGAWRLSKGEGGGRWPGGPH